MILPELHSPLGRTDGLMAILQKGPNHGLYHLYSSYYQKTQMLHFPEILQEDFLADPGILPPRLE